MNDKTFFPFYEERISRAAGKLQSGYKIASFWSENIWNGIAADLYEVFHKAAIRCLIAELHRCKDSGLLSGETAEEEYDSYCDLLKDVQYVDTVYQKYPGLLHYLDKLEEIQVCFWEELLGRLVSDWEEIKEYFYIDAESHVLSIQRSGSDFHCKGKSVVIIETDRKNILYKPHPIENEVFLQTLLADIYRDLVLKRFFYRELDKKSYGWVEEVTWEECGSNDEVIRFYKRVGVLAATAYVLGIGDLHYENIIAHGEFPVIIDAETLFQHMEPLYQWKEKTTDFYSVLSSGLFPGGTADLNTAGITGGDGCISLKKIPVIMNDKTSEMCVDYQKVPMPKGKNHVRYQGKAAGWEGYEQEILEGFRLTYEWFRENKDKVLENILDSKDKLRSRYVSGGTQFFGLSLFASVHPELMTSIYGRQYYMEKIFKDRKLGNQEMEAILRGDIPCFFRNLTDQSIYDGQKITACDFFESIIVEKMEWRLKGLCVEDRILQEKVIAYSIKVFKFESSFQTLYWRSSASQACAMQGYKKDCKVEKEYGEKAVNDEKIIEFNGIECAKDIADYILENSINQKDKIFWLGIGEENGTIKIRPVDIYFYNGIAGIAVFFQKMYQICGQYKNICIKLKKMLFSYTDRICRKEIYPITEYTGMYCGEGSVVYAYQLLYQITHECIYQSYAEKHAKILFQYIERDKNLDLLYGNAGAVLILCQQYINTMNEIYLLEAQKALMYLENKRIETEQGVTWFEKAEGNPICSIAHGNSGMLLAYARMESLIHNNTWVKRMYQIMKYEDQYYNDTYGNWADLRKKSNWWKTFAWCNGGIGVIYARMLAKKWNPEKFEDIDIKRKVRQLLKKIVILKKMCLCHGNMGNLIILQNIANELDDSEIIVKYMDRGKMFLSSYYVNNRRWKEEVDFGVMSGLAGEGMGVLYI